MPKRTVIVANDKIQKGSATCKPPQSAGISIRNSSPIKPPATDAAARGVLRQVPDRYPKGVSAELVRARARLSPRGRDCALNFFGVDASQPLSVWRNRDGFTPMIRAAGSSGIAAITWATGIQAEDRRQIKRWKAIRRHIRQIERRCEPGICTVRPRQRQALLHWAYDSRKI